MSDTSAIFVNDSGPQGELPGISAPDRVAIADMPIPALVRRAVAMLRQHVPPEGYYLAFSGGKDSCAIKKLADMAGVKYDAWYNNTTIDPPELVRFIKRVHPDVRWNNPPMAMLTMMATDCSSPPTRWYRWCCEIYKERNGKDRCKVMGVRAAESPARKRNWAEAIGTSFAGNPMVVAPICFWTDAQLWRFLDAYNVPVCELYAEGWKRLGCVGCPLVGCDHQAREFARWPGYERAWHRAIVRNWEKWHDVPKKDGTKRYQGWFKSGEQMYEWWRTMKSPRAVDDCVSAVLWTNDPEEP